MASKTQIYQTDLSCESCVESLRPHLDQEPSIHEWTIDVTQANKPFRVSGENLDLVRLKAIFAREGYHLLKELSELNESGEPGNSSVSQAQAGTPGLRTYFPLILILAYLLLSLLLLKPEHPMPAFMGGFFLIFSFFKFLNLKGFADAYQTYDVLAKHSRAYAFIYPFIELALAIGYLGGIAPLWVNLATLFVMLLSSVGVIQSLLKKRAIPCACLGTVFQLPMTKVTLFEDFLMAGMALLALVRFQ